MTNVKTHEPLDNEKLNQTSVDFGLFETIEQKQILGDCYKYYKVFNTPALYAMDIFELDTLLTEALNLILQQAVKSHNVWTKKVMIKLLKKLNNDSSNLEYRFEVANQLCDIYKISLQDHIKWLWQIM